MKEYIERASVHSIIEQTSTFTFAWGGMHEQIDSLPAADVAEVVRCRDCVYAQKKYGHIECLNGISYRNTYNNPNMFCSYSQRKIETVLPKSDAKDESLEAGQ